MNGMFNSEQIGTGMFLEWTWLLARICRVWFFSEKEYEAVQRLRDVKGIKAIVGWIKKPQGKRIVRDIDLNSVSKRK